jgi:hypothetical protein
MNRAKNYFLPDSATTASSSMSSTNPDDTIKKATKANTFIRSSSSSSSADSDKNTSQNTNHQLAPLPKQEHNPCFQYEFIQKLQQDRSKLNNQELSFSKQEHQQQKQKQQNVSPYPNIKQNKYNHNNQNC